MRFLKSNRLSPTLGDSLLRRCTFSLVVGGNQRELARQKNLKKNQDLNKGKRKDDALSAAQRKQRDSEIMQLKQKAANEKKSVQTGSV
ncbi:small EDRK-rich factor 1 isoform X3 [Engystomops pustulosus]|uniref:small EDRK-rich factor 1 isoform X3 n=1 Tax=Engystomops pustulosus TaxID=76066 RepID=UPI003AFB2E01